MEELLIIMDKNKANWVSASDVGRAAFCGHFLELKYAGHKVSKYSEQLMKQGDIAHDDLNKLAEDKRCFIATHLYGINHVKTQKLRTFRDNYLQKSCIGRFTIRVYYRFSPSLIFMARRSQLIHSLLNRLVNMVVLKVEDITNG